MDYPQKIELITNLKFLDILEQFKPKFRDRPSEDSDVPLEELEEEEDFFSLISEITDKLG